MSIHRIAVCEAAPELQPGSDAWVRMREALTRLTPELLVLNELPFGRWISAGERFEPDVWKGSIEAHRDAAAALGELDVPTIIGSQSVEIDGRPVNPDSIVLLSTRDPERWYESVRDTIWATSQRLKRSKDPSERRRGEWAELVVWGPAFGGRFEDRDFALAALRRHERAIRVEIPPERLLVYEAANGWEPLCRALGCAVPETPFPRTNTRAEFQARRADASREGGRA